MPSPEDKKRALTKSKAMSSRMTTKVTPAAAVHGEGTLANPRFVAGLNVSMMENPAAAEKLLEGVIPPVDGEEVEKLDLDRVMSKFFHVVGQMWQEDEGGGDDSTGTVYFAVEELRRMKEDQDATVESLEKGVAELKKKEALAKKSAIEEYKPSDDFQEVVKQAASRYFNEGNQVLRLWNSNNLRKYYH
ncbi:hypothetical protein Acr_00g0030250 [Actinidia rufa]|uniref:Uncharacterized protein n=1 Tax=Actinidia rufa TaxID=165716 RepID=A0A7J0DGP4_9ERIC|nr:hypothetical protein Acr_00g0030250 [Actinidia rufa]